MTDSTRPFMNMAWTGKQATAAHGLQWLADPCLSGVIVNAHASSHPGVIWDVGPLLDQRTAIHKPTHLALRVQQQQCRAIHRRVLAHSHTQALCLGAQGGLPRAEHDLHGGSGHEGMAKVNKSRLMLAGSSTGNMQLCIHASEKHTRLERSAR